MLYNEIFEPPILREENLIKLKNLSFESIREKLRFDLLLIYMQRIMNVKNLSIAEFALLASQAVSKKILEDLKQKYDKDLSEQLMNEIYLMFEKIRLFKQGELSSLDENEASVWIVKDDVFKSLQEGNIDFIKNIFHQRRTNLKLFFKLKELFVKINKLSYSKIKDCDIDILAKKLNDYEKAKIKVQRDKRRLLQKEEKQINTDIVENKSKKTKSSSNNSDVMMKIPIKLKEMTHSMVEQDKTKKLVPSIHKFFKAKHGNINSTNISVDRYKRYNSLGSSKINIKNKNNGYNNVDNWCKNPFRIDNINIKGRFHKPLKQEGYNKEITKVRFVRLEDYMKDFNEYKGYLQTEKFPIHPPKNQLVRFNDTFNYDLLTDDELQILDAESCSRSIEETDEDMTDAAIEDFLVPDDHISDDETESVKKIRKEKEKLVSKMSSELKISAINFNILDKKDALIQKYAIINLTNTQYPLPLYVQRVTKPDECDIDDNLFARIVLLIAGMQTKKDVYKLLVEKGIDISRKTVFDKLFESASLCYFVEPIEFETYVNKDYYDTLISSLRDKNNDKKKTESSTYMERLILLTHGSVSNADTRDEKIYRDLKAIYPQVTKQNLEKTIKKIAQVGYIFYPEFLDKLVI